MKVLVVSTWFPYPCNQGSKTRAYHLIKALARDHRICLISFEDQPIHLEWLLHMKEFCERIEILPGSPFQYPKWKSILGNFSIQPSAIVASYSKAMENLVLSTAADWQPDLALAFTHFTAPYVLKIPGVKKIVDMDNLITKMLYEEIASSTSNMQRARRFLAYLKFRRFENKVYSKFDLCLAASKKDTEGIQQYTKIGPQQVLCVPNGADLDFYQVDGGQKKAQELVFNGALTYSPNFDAMQYFVCDIFPSILSRFPDCFMKITGKTDGVEKDRLCLNPSIQFTGYVEDIRPVVGGAEICVVPLRKGGGTRLKILEAMALGTAVVSTTKGAEGLDIQPDREYLRADTSQEFIQAISRLLNDREVQKRLVAQARKTVEMTYDWKQIGQNFLSAVNQLAS